MKILHHIIHIKPDCAANKPNASFNAEVAFWCWGSITRQVSWAKMIIFQPSSN